MFLKFKFPIKKSKALQISSLHNIIKRFRDTGEISVRKGQGRRPLWDARCLWALRRHCITHRHDSVFDITKWAQEYFQKPLSVNTIHRAICRCQLMLYHAKGKPYVNMVQKRHRVLWAMAHLKWTVSKWKSVLWSPNVTFLLEITDAVSMEEEGGLPACYQHSVNAERYIKVLEQHMLPSRRRVFQQNNTKPHTAAITTSWIHSRRVWVLNPDAVQSRSFTYREHLTHH